MTHGSEPPTPPPRAESAEEPKGAGICHRCHEPMLHGQELEADCIVPRLNLWTAVHKGCTPKPAQWVIGPALRTNTPGEPGETKGTDS